MTCSGLGHRHSTYGSPQRDVLSSGHVADAAGWPDYATAAIGCDVTAGEMSHDFAGILCLKWEGFLITVCFDSIAPFLLVNLFFINELYQKRSFFQPVL